jgi:DNA polymerase-3 subunit chi
VTRIDFYVLPGHAADRALAGCRLTAKAFAQKHRVYLHAASPAEVGHLDELLWTFRDTSFVPHRPADDERLPDAPVVIGCAEPPAGHDDVLVNLTDAVPPFFSRFQRVVELVPAEPDVRSRARERFRFYQERGYQPDTHQLER